MNKKAPVLVIFFNRPNTLKEVLEQLYLSKPNRIYLFQDGPRLNEKTDVLKIEECRNLVESYNWDCEIYKKYMSENLGCGLGPKLAIDWFLENEDYGIILEDDCIPSLSFFPFCSELLHKYYGDKRIFLITGCNMELKSKIDESYFFGYSGTNCGWATWNYNWKKMDYACKWLEDENTKKILNKYLNKVFNKKGRREYKAFLETYKKLKSGDNISYWDLQWQAVRYLNHQLSIIPSVNLITNIGIGSESTHAKYEKKPKKYHDKTGDINFVYNKRYEITFPLKEPVCMIPNTEYDNKVDKKLNGNIFCILFSKIKNMFRRQKNKC